MLGDQPDLQARREGGRGGEEREREREREGGKRELNTSHSRC